MTTTTESPPALVESSALTALQLEVGPPTCRGRAATAYMAGRLLNELRYRKEVAWLTLLEPPPRIAELWCTVIAMFRDLGPGTEWAIERVEESRRSWRVRFRGRGHLEQLDAANDFLKCEQRFGDCAPGSRDERHHLAQVVGGQWAWDIESWQMAPELVRLLRLGVHVDHGVHPAVDSPGLRWWPPVNREHLERSPWEVSTKTEPSWRLPDREPSVSSGWPDSEWRVLVNWNCRQCGWSLPDTNASDTVPEDGPTAVAAVLRTIEERLSAQDRPQREISSLGHFGITVAPDGRTLFREGYDIPVGVAPRIARLLAVLVEEPGPWTFDRLRVHWPHIGRGTCSRSTAEDAMTSLRDAIHPLGLEVVNDVDRRGHFIRSVGS